MLFFFFIFDILLCVKYKFLYCTVYAQHYKVIKYIIKQPVSPSRSRPSSAFLTGLSSLDLDLLQDVLRYAIYFLLTWVYLRGKYRLKGGGGEVVYG